MTSPVRSRACAPRLAGGDVDRGRRRRAVGRAGGCARDARGAERRPPIEVVWTSERLGHGAAIEHRPAPRDAVTSSILLDPSIEPTGDVVTPLVAALDDPTVAVAGGWGIVSTDLRKFEDAPAGDVDAIEGYLQAFRRSDAAARGPLDEHFRFYRNLDIWWSLVLRDEGEDDAAATCGRPSRTCPPSVTSIAATRACPTPSATARASATSTGSSTGSAGAATCSSAADRGGDAARARPGAARRSGAGRAGR